MYYNYNIFTCSNIDVSLSHAFPAANSPAATIDTSTPRGLSSCLKHKAKPSRPACVAHCAPRTGVGIFDKAENFFNYNFFSFKQ